MWTISADRSGFSLWASRMASRSGRPPGCRASGPPSRGSGLRCGDWDWRWGTVDLAMERVSASSRGSTVPLVEVDGRRAEAVCPGLVDRPAAMRGVPCRKADEELRPDSLGPASPADEGEARAPGAALPASYRDPRRRGTGARRRLRLRVPRCGAGARGRSRRRRCRRCSSTTRSPPLPRASGRRSGTGRRETTDHPREVIEGGAGIRRPEQGGGGLRPVGSVRAVAAADGRLGGAPRRQRPVMRPLTTGAEVPVDVARGYPARLDGVDRRLRAPRR